MSGELPSKLQGGLSSRLSDKLPGKANAGSTGAVVCYLERATIIQHSCKDKRLAVMSIGIAAKTNR